MMVQTTPIKTFIKQPQNPFFPLNPSNHRSDNSDQNPHSNNLKKSFFSPNQENQGSDNQENHRPDKIK